MEIYLYYTLEASGCLAFFYGMYYFFLRKETGFRYIRLYFLISIVISMILPFNRVAIHPFKEIGKVSVFSVPVNPNQTNFEKKGLNSNGQGVTHSEVEKITIHYIFFIFLFYLLIAGIQFGRYLVGLGLIIYYYNCSSKEKIGNMVIVKNERIHFSFSFYHLIFLNPAGLSQNEINSIIAHENIHVSQYHSIDILILELLSAVMWFNPIVWLLQKSLRQVHEYLADEGVLAIGFDRLEYQTLLINQVAEGRLMSLTSSLNQSFIKNRILMMTKLHSDNRTKLKILTLVPISAILFLSIACMNGQKPVVSKDTILLLPPVPPPPPAGSSLDNHSATDKGAVAATKMNVLYLGVDNPIDVAISGIKAEDLDVTIDNGSIKGSHGMFIARPSKYGKAIITVFSKGKILRESVFRVKSVHDPVPRVGGKMGGDINREDLLRINDVSVVLENFDFDMSFDIIGVTVSATVNGLMQVCYSNSGKITSEQKDLIKKVHAGDWVYFTDIKCKGTDGLTRNVGTEYFTLKN